MAPKKLIWQLFPSYLFITIVAVIAVTGYVSVSLRHFYATQTEDELTRLARIVRRTVVNERVLDSYAQSNRLCREVGQAANNRIRVTIILPNGKVIGDSVEDITKMEDHSNREEIMTALASGFGRSTRRSPTLGINMMYVAIPVRNEAKNLAVVRTAIATTDIDRALGDMLKKIALCGLAVAVGAAAISLLASRRISQPIVVMEGIARAFSEGHLEQRVPIWSTSELQSLAHTLNQMARQLDERIRSATSQRNELEVILAGMVEGVIAVDGEGHIVSVNRAAAHLLHIQPEEVNGQPLDIVIRDVGLRRFMQQTLHSTYSQENELMLSIDGTGVFQVHGTRLPDDEQPQSGAVIVLNDMTRIHRLERLRRDFVANVSHELKTPVTSIKGFLEAISDLGVADPEKTRHYLAIATRHANRLNAIIDDLLTLSRLEEDTDRRDILFEATDLREVIGSALELSTIKAQAKSIELTANAPKPVMVHANAALLEQALINLIDNAIKYSDTGSPVQVALRQDDNQIEIAVSDTGCGIAEQHQGHVFERFYVADKGRSRKLGGTGLGLAIVKHIANVHGGWINLQSKLGAGSTFTLCLPKNNRDVSRS